MGALAQRRSTQLSYKLIQTYSNLCHTPLQATGKHAGLARHARALQCTYAVPSREFPHCRPNAGAAGAAATGPPDQLQLGLQPHMAGCITQNKCPLYRTTWQLPPVRRTKN
jgi:hypothetical protein